MKVKPSDRSRGLFVRFLALTSHASFFFLVGVCR